MDIPLIEEIKVNCWAEINSIIKSLRDDYIFRGENKLYPKLASSIERKDCYKEFLSLERYVELIKEFKKYILANGYNDKFIPSDEIFFLDNLDPTGAISTLGFSFSNELLKYIILLRHHYFPTPLLDWSFNLDVAAYFAFIDCDPLKDELVSIYACRENIEFGRFYKKDEPLLKTAGGFIENITPRHSAQKATYTFAIESHNSSGFKTIDHLYGFQSIVDTKDRADFLKIKRFLIPSSEKATVINYLDSKGINKEHIFQGVVMEGERLDKLAKEFIDQTFPE
jgi:hypothetical protein